MMNIKQSFINTVRKSEIQREVTFILADNTKKDQHKKIKNEVFNNFVFINRNILKKIDEISKRCNILPLRMNVELSSPAWPIFDGSIKNMLSGLASTSNLRVLVNFEEFNADELNDTFLDSQLISHLVEVSFYEHRNGDLNSFNTPTATVYVDSSIKGINIIEDVMLDISMYYTFIKTNSANDIQFRRNFSKSKIDLQKQSLIKAEDWDTEIHTQYIPVASYFRNKLNFDYTKYIEFWEKLGENNTKVVRNENSELQLRDQLIRHKDFGELPVKRLVKEFNLLPKGDFVLARLVRIPRSTRKRNQLQTIFGGKTLRRGKVKFFQINQVEIFNELVESINLFKITK